jgi:hypothetical protein
VRRTEPPSGTNPPARVDLGGGDVVLLEPLAERLCDLYFAIYPDDLERYDEGVAEAWALEDARAGLVDVVEQVKWLGRVLEARSFPVERLARHVELVAAVIDASIEGEVGQRAAERMRMASEALGGSERGRNGVGRG